MSIYSIFGQIGSGKSFYQLKLALELANYKEKQLVFNFPIDRKGLAAYADHKKMEWIKRLLKYGGISEVHAPKNLQELMLPQAVVCLDEAGVLLNSRSWKDTPKEFLADLCQSRKFGTDLIWAAQFSEQVDSQLRHLTQFWIFANGLTYYCKKSRLPKLYYKRYYFMDAMQHHRWLNKGAGHFKTRLAFTYRYHGGFLGKTDRLLFDCFDTTIRLDHLKGDSVKHIEDFSRTRSLSLPPYEPTKTDTRLITVNHMLNLSSRHFQQLVNLQCDRLKAGNTD